MRNCFQNQLHFCKVKAKILLNSTFSLSELLSRDLSLYIGDNCKLDLAPKGWNRGKNKYKFLCIMIDFIVYSLGLGKFSTISAKFKFHSTLCLYYLLSHICKIFEN